MDGNELDMRPFVTINVALYLGTSLPLSMPGATTVRYAAKRAAEAFALDPNDSEYFLLEGTERLPREAVIADHANKELQLGAFL